VAVAAAGDVDAAVQTGVLNVAIDAALLVEVGVESLRQLLEAYRARWRL
jgi:hypothetical protein